jgi:hypothetical protein
MKRGNEALNVSSLHRYVFLLSVKRFIAVTFLGKSSLNASSPLLFEEDSSLNAASPLLFKVTWRSSEVGGSLDPDPRLN